MDLSIYRSYVFAYERWMWAMRPIRRDCGAGQSTPPHVRRIKGQHTWLSLTFPWPMCGRVCRFTENHAQTATCLVKHKQEQAVLASTREVGCTATAFEIHDATMYAEKPMHTLDRPIRSCVQTGMRLSKRGNSIQWKW